MNQWQCHDVKMKLINHWWVAIHSAQPLLIVNNTIFRTDWEHFAGEFQLFIPRNLITEKEDRFYNFCLNCYLNVENHTRESVFLNNQQHKNVSQRPGKYDQMC